MSEPFYSLKGGATALTRGEGQAFARSILNSQAYRDDLKLRASQGKLAPAVEVMLWHYGYGKPVEQVNINVTPGTEDLASLPIDELHRRALELERYLAEAVQLAEAIPAEILYGTAPGAASANYDSKDTTNVTH
jgi:hypothetical protein